MALRSMTGYGQWTGNGIGFVQTWEVRSVNGRYLDPKWRLPVQIRNMEPRLEKVLRTFASRGRIEINLALQYTGTVGNVHFDQGQAATLFDAISAFAASRGDVFQPDYGSLLNLSGLWTSASSQEDELWTVLSSGFSQALEEWNKSRREEGESLTADLYERFAKLSDWIGQISERAPDIKKERFAQVRERLQDMLSTLGNELDEARFLQEMVIMADRLDVSEELVRLQAHLKRLSDVIKTGEDVGRKLEFTLQECFREINTCGNKIQDIAVSHIVVDFKNELEKCREQVQNLE